MLEMIEMLFNMFVLKTFHPPCHPVGPEHPVDLRH
jgi:hypothetical protein